MGSQFMMSTDFTYSITSIRFDEGYRPADSTRVTTNFANLARGEHCQRNIRNALCMIDNRFNGLANWDNPHGDRYAVELDIISVDIDVEGNGDHFPSIELLQTTIVDRHRQKRIPGIVGNNFSSYVRDYDFSIRLREHNKYHNEFCIPNDFGDLHGKLFQSFLNSSTYHNHFKKPPVVCLSVSENKTYIRCDNRHPLMGIEYQPNEASLTEQYFGKMGFSVRYFMPPGSVAPLAFFFFGDLLNDYSNLELFSTISTMETFQKIYRPEIYNANAAAAAHYRPNLQHSDHSVTQIDYDREERNQLATKQAKFAQQHFMLPYQQILERWSNSQSL